MTSARHAVVVVASFAGLSAARVLADRFERVTILERDWLPEGAEDRAGTPQGRHVHALLARGLAELEALFPGFRARALELGAVEMDMGRDAAFLRIYGWAPRFDSGTPLLLASRWLFEAVAREICARHPKIELRDTETKCRRGRCYHLPRYARLRSMVIDPSTGQSPPTALTTSPSKAFDTSP